MKLWLHSLSVALLILLSTQSGLSQWIDDPQYDRLVKQGVAEIYNLEFDSADRTFREVVNRWPSHPSGYFFRAMVDWWRITIEPENRSFEAAFSNKLEHVIEMCDRKLDSNPDDVTSLFFKGGAIGFRGRRRVTHEEWLTAANDGRIAIPIVQHLFQLDPSNYDVLLGIGIYNYYAEVLPREYPLIKPIAILFPKGNRALGIAQLMIASEKAKYAWAEATYFLLQIYYGYEKDYAKALGLAEKLSRSYPRNSVFRRFIGRCDISLSRWTESQQVWSGIIARCDRSETGYSAHVKREALYYLGLCAMSWGQLKEALRYYYACDELSRSTDQHGPSPFMVMANLKIGMVYDLQNRRDLALEQYRKVTDWRDFYGSHREAEKYIERPYGK